MVLDLADPLLLTLGGYTVVGIWWGSSIHTKVSAILKTLEKGEFIHCREHRQIMVNLNDRVTRVEVRLDDHDNANGRDTASV